MSDEGKAFPKAALDTNVIIYGMMKGATGKVGRWHQECKPLLNSPYWLPTVVASELLPFLSEDEIDGLGLARMPQLPIGFEDADAAGHLLREIGKQPKRCHRCFVPIGAKNCNTCKEKTKSRDVVRDAMILSACATDPRVKVLYTYNLDDFLPMVPHLRDGSVEVRKPPNIFGGPIGEAERDEV